jgi:hypothetical protein
VLPYAATTIHKNARCAGEMCHAKQIGAAYGPLLTAIRGMSGVGVAVDETNPGILRAEAAAL